MLILATVFLWSGVGVTPYSEIILRGEPPTILDQWKYLPTMISEWGVTPPQKKTVATVN